MGQAHNRQGRGKIVVFANLRSELKAITEWSRRPQIFRTQTERHAVVIRELRRRELLDS
jgi:hypothetical protein